MLALRVRLVRARIRPLKRTNACGAIRRLGCRCPVKLKPQNSRSHGRAATLFRGLP